MKKMRPPVLCKCDKVSRYASRRRGGMLGFLGFGLKAALAAAAWYVTYDMGIWGTSDDTYEMYRSYCKIMKGPCPDKEEKWEPVQCKAEKQLMTVCNSGNFTSLFCSQSNYGTFICYCTIKILNKFSLGGYPR